MANLYVVTVTVGGTKEVRVVAASPEEATAKVTLGEGETVSSVTDQGEVQV